MLTYHLVAVAEYEAAAAEYLPAAFAAEGFIHTTKRLAIVHEVANRYYRGDERPYQLLTIDLERLRVPWRYDAAGEDYPHIYGALNREAIVGTRALRRAADGSFLPLADE